MSQVFFIISALPLETLLFFGTNRFLSRFLKKYLPYVIKHFLCKKEGEVDNNFALKKKRLEGVAKKKNRFFFVALCYEGKIYCESRTKINGLKRAFLSKQFGVRFEGCENITQNRISRSSST